ncbi:MAG: PIN domain-containing protein [Candidatus Aenigmarchaeota archaeon]|nr:PIN domain-containing protein [Candidatus Aenigmarchaeota archaeon]
MPEEIQDSKQKIYLDTFVFMDMLSGQKDLMEKAKKYIVQPSMVSSIIFAELVFHMVRNGVHKSKKDEILFYVRSLENLEIMNVTGEIAELAGKIRAKNWKKLNKKLTYFDSIHLATALVNNAKRFVTGDKDFRGIEEVAVEIY